MNTAKNPWFAQNLRGQIVLSNIHPSRDMRAGYIPKYLIGEVYRRNPLSMAVLRLYCSFSFIPLLLLCVGILTINLVLQYVSLDPNSAWVQLPHIGFWFVLAFLAFLTTFAIVWKDVREFELCLEHIITICGHTLSPDTFPKTPRELDWFINGILLELAVATRRFELNAAEEKDAALARVIKERAEESREGFVGLFDAAEALGISVSEDGYGPYFGKANEKLDVVKKVLLKKII